MKKSAYVIGGILIGFVFATSTGAFADSVKSLIGKKVTGEYTVIVNGEMIADKGGIIDGRANVPIRGISEALEADITVKGKTITVTTSKAKTTDISPAKPTSSSGNKYAGSSKESLEELKQSIEKNRIKPAVEEREHILQEIEILKKPDAFGQSAPNLEVKQKQLAEYDEIIRKATEELGLVEEALAAIR
ncbi:copper amine oxidase [Paenibacillus sp. F411]|uniref:stalk domain-containing protein n=1 Tax=Paenibacillus sp. F411 TaxID=2820239 RepID=UPI001AAF6160|nr:stalk domain-containing protein [Paenibacillus sp. F411]MBO2942821.1 copper amine oxidase [Paenibacillus sp. F411]